MQVIAKLVEDVNKRTSVATTSPAIDLIDQETAYVWGSQGRLPVFQRITKVSLPGVN